MEQHAQTEAGPVPGRLRQALLARKEARIDLRNRRAERLARLRAAAATDDAVGGEPLAEGEGPPAARLGAAPGEPEVAAGDVEALERFLAGLLGTIEPEAEPLPQPARLSPSVIPLSSRGEEAPPQGDAAGLARLPGAGPGLISALIRAGVPDLETLARLDADDLRGRLGPLALLIDVGGWVVFAQSEVSAAALRRR
jgi:hypothetical protein